MEKLLNALELCGLDPRISSIFSYMELAEEEISRYKKTYPHKAELIHGAFKHLCPTDFITTKKLYIFYIKEILNDIIETGEYTRKVRLSEILGLLSSLSLEAPFKYEYAAFAIFLFNELEKQYGSGKLLEPLSEPYKDCFAQTLVELAQTLEKRRT